MHSSRSYFDLEQRPVTIRAFRSLTHDHADAVSKVVRPLSGKWSVDCHDDYNGYLLILILPAQSLGDWLGFLISGTIECIELAELRDEQLIQIDSFTNVGAASAELASRLMAF